MMALYSKTVAVLELELRTFCFLAFSTVSYRTHYLVLWQLLKSGGSMSPSIMQYNFQKFQLSYISMIHLFFTEHFLFRESILLLLSAYNTC